jgi:glycosyltransferase involved in cell wall biosynthesis
VQKHKNVHTVTLRKITKHPWLSVIIPSYNGEDYLPFALDSIAIQGDHDIECIVVDDGSTDATMSILSEYQKKFPIRILQRERQGNWVANTNYGLTFATGDYVSFLHQDDLWFNHRLSSMKRLTLDFPGVVLFVHSARYLDATGNEIGLWQCPLPSYPQTINSSEMIEKLLVQNFISISAPIFSREAARRAGELEKNFWYTADWDFWLKIAACGDTLYYPQPLSGFRLHPMSQTITRSSEAIGFREQLETVANKYFARWEAPERRKLNVRRVADFSIEVNTALAGKVHGKKPNFVRLLIRFLLLGPSGWHRYIRDSRIQERVSARLKAQLRPSRVLVSKQHEERHLTRD